jgi:hypothetical protein
MFKTIGFIFGRHRSLIVYAVQCSAVQCNAHAYINLLSKQCILTAHAQNHIFNFFNCVVKQLDAIKNMKFDDISDEKFGIIFAYMTDSRTLKKGSVISEVRCWQIVVI